jgi:hypothetical protein
MARLVWLVFMAAVVGGLVAGASFLAATFGAGTVLGAPPPEMGHRTVEFLWDGMPKRRDHPRAWRFAFSGTHIPGAPNVTMYFSPLGKVLQVDPSDLPDRIKAFHNTGY